MSGATTGLGVVFAIAAGAVLALSMVVQRYALAHPGNQKTPPRVPLLWWDLPPNAVWFVGLLLYGISAGGLYSVAGLFISLSLLAALFATLLIFNLFFSRWLLGEELTSPRIGGAWGILLGTTLCVIGRAEGAPTDFTPREVRDLYGQPRGYLWLTLLFALIVSSVVAIVQFERRYPTVDVLKAEQVDESKHRTSSARGHRKRRSSARSNHWSVSGGDEMPTTDGIETSTTGDMPRGQALAGGADEGGASPPQETDEGGVLPLRLPPPWLDRVMLLVYPASLGLDEGIAHLTLRAMNAMLNQCSDNDNCLDFILFFTIALWVTASGATLWWLRVVYARYEVTDALPIEYGAATAADICSGLLFFGEYEYMSTSDIVLQVFGLMLIIGSIGVSLMETPPWFAELVDRLESRLPRRNAAMAAPATSETRAPPSSTAENTVARRRVLPGAKSAAC